jgi:hypothetical protein
VDKYHSGQISKCRNDQLEKYQSRELSNGKKYQSKETSMPREISTVNLIFPKREAILDRAQRRNIKAENY